MQSTKLISKSSEWPMMNLNLSATYGCAQINLIKHSQVSQHPIINTLLLIVWFEGKFENLDSEQIDSNVNEWANELKRLSKSSIIQNAPKQKELLEFI